ncbi:MAG: Lrp/AsnC family transcriptional regulator [Pseudomonadota bacterium]
MDQLDIRILEALQRKADLTNAELAEIVGSTTSTCLRRVDRLRHAGVIARTVAIADNAKIGRGLKAIILVTTRDQPRSEREKFAARIRVEPAITQAYGVTGEADAVLVGNFRSMEEYQSFCDRFFDDEASVVRYTTHLVAETYKNDTFIPCDGVQLRKD